MARTSRDSCRKQLGCLRRIYRRPPRARVPCGVAVDGDGGAALDELVDRCHPNTPSLAHRVKRAELTTGVEA
jgi:hypothetical protein